MPYKDCKEVNNMKKVKVCFVAPGIYPCFTGNFLNSKIGGAELQQTFIAKQLAKKGMDVSCVTLDYGQPGGEVIDGVKMYSAYSPNEGIPALRFYYPNFWKLWQAFRRADADIYYVRCAGFLLGAVRLFCTIHKKKFVFAGAHDTDFIPKEVKIRFFRDKLLYQYGLKGANAIIVQTKRQLQLLKNNFKLNGIIIPNFLPFPVKDRERDSDDIILWVATIRKWKQPFHFIRLAKSFPSQKFVMIGGKDDFAPEVYKKVVDEAQKLRNLDFMGFEPFEKTERYFDRCKIFVNTSQHEGFPNTFLQAWRRGIPVISYVDPDDVIKNNGLGIVVKTENELARALDHLNNQLQQTNITSKIKKYYRENHSPAVIAMYEQLFIEILNSKK